jgi:DNA-binding beta-propeller fold protein YncE
MKSFFTAILAIVLMTVLVTAQPFTHYEARHCHPIAITPDGTKILVVNSADGRLSVLVPGANGTPILIAEIPTGNEPVSVRARNNHEAWVVNEVSDSVSIIDLTEMRVIDSLSAADEPADVHFANGKAFVTCARNGIVRVFDAVTRSPLPSIPIQGLYPTAMSSSADGSKLYASFLLSGNRTTVLPADNARSQPNPTNPALPAPPKTALIVPSNDSRVNYQVLDHDVVEIDTQTMSVIRYLSDVGTNLFDHQVHPTTGELWVLHSDSLNTIAFEPNLKGHFSFHRLSRQPLSANASAVPFDLNPGVNYAAPGTAAIIANGLAQPTALAIEPSGSHGWVAAFNSDRVAKVNLASGAIEQRINVRTGADVSSSAMRGPRGLVLHPTQPFLYVSHKFTQSVSVISTANNAILSEVSISSVNVIPESLRRGRGYLYDARLSSHGTVSCATCHLDADRDGLAWDLGDPGGAMVIVKGSALSAHITSVKNRDLHPMKGPMVTQTLRGMASNTTSVTTPAASVTTKFHWRGDKPSIQSFNSTFADLLGGALIDVDDMNDLTNYLLSLRHHPNPNRNFDRTLKTAVSGGNAVAGRDLFNDHLASHCATCHPLASGTDQNIDLMSEVGGKQPIKNPPLRTVYQRAAGFNPTPGASSLSGFGMSHDGTGFALPKVHPYALDELTNAELVDVTAFIMSFDTGTAPVAAASHVVTSANAVAMSAALQTMETAAMADGDLIVHGRIDGGSMNFLWNKASQRYQSDQQTSATWTRASLLSLLHAGDAFVFSGTPAGQGAARSIDRDADSVPDGLELVPRLSIEMLANASVRLSWADLGGNWHLQRSESLADIWETEMTNGTLQSGHVIITKPRSRPREFFRLQRNW